MTRLRIAGAFAAAFAAFAFGTYSGAKEPAPVTPSDYVVRWDFGSGADASLVPSGGARLGVELTGPDLAESLMRGGDGKVAEIPKGGRLERFAALLKARRARRSGVQSVLSERGAGRGSRNDEE